MKKRVLSIILSLILLVQTSAFAYAAEEVQQQAFDFDTDQVVLQEVLEENSLSEAVEPRAALDRPEISEEPEASEALGTSETSEASGMLDIIDTSKYDGETNALGLETVSENVLTEAENTEAENTEAENTEADNAEADNAEAENTEADNAEADNVETGNTETDDIVTENMESGDPEGLIEDPAEGEEPQLLVAQESGVLDDAIMVHPDGASQSGMALFSRSVVQYQDCYANQLDEFSGDLYEKRVNYYAVEKNTGQMAITYTRATCPSTYSADVIRNAEGTATAIDKNSESYQDYCEQICYSMQSSLDAFLYDHPEIFWLRGGSYSYTIRAASSTSGEWTGYVSSITYTPNEAFTGASSLIAAYDAAVSAVASELTGAADYDGNGITEQAELAQAAHDYLCKRMYYDNASLANYTQTKDYRIFCSAGAFLDSVGTGVVCEGYAKAYKVLCDRLGIPCACIGGVVNSSGIGHMWNGVQLEGKWYLTDVTWDDSSSGTIRYQYYLCGDLSSSRTSSGNFSGAAAGKTTVFTYPVLQTTKYNFCLNGAHDYVLETRDSTCVEEGYRKNTCNTCGYAYYIERTAAQRSSHDYQPVVTPSDCTHAGYTTYTCIYCDDSYQAEEQPALGHDYVNEICTRCGDRQPHDYQPVVTPPDCIHAGYTTYTCSHCGDSYQEEGSPALGHNYINGQCTRCQSYQSIAAAAIAAVPDVTYTSTEIRPAVTVSFGTRVLTAGVDYTTVYRSNVNVGTAWIDITGNGNYSGTKSISFIIKKASAALSFQSSALTKTYGAGSFTNGLKNPKGLFVTYTSSNPQVAVVDSNGTVTMKGSGTTTITASSDGTISSGGKAVSQTINYTSTTSAYRLTVNKAANQITAKDQTVHQSSKSRSLNLAVRQTGDAKLTYRSSSKSVTVNSSGKVVIAKNYVGRVTITIKAGATDCYKAASTTVQITVRPSVASLTRLSNQSKRKLVISWKKKSNVNGYQIQYSTSKTFASGRQTITIKNAGTTAKTITGLKKGKQYYVRIRTWRVVSGKRIYSEWSNQKSIKIKR